MIIKWLFQQNVIETNCDVSSSKQTEGRDNFGQSHGFDDNFPVSPISVKVIETPLSKVEKPPKQAFPSAFVLFKNEQIQKLKQTNLNSKIDKKFGVDAWGELSEEGKKVHHT